MGIFGFWTEKDWSQKSYYGSNISKTKKDISKRKTPFFCVLKGLSTKPKTFLCHTHFKELVPSKQTEC